MWRDLIKLFSNGTWGKVGKIVTASGVVASIIPVLVWFSHHTDDKAACLTWGALAIIGVMGAFMLGIVYLTRPGQHSDRGT